MERRRAIAWAGSIAMFGSISAFALGSLVGGFGVGPSPAQETQVDSPSLIPGDIERGPAPRGTEPGPTTEDTEPGPTLTAPAAAGTDPRSPAGGARFQAKLPPSPVVARADLDDGPGPQVSLEVPHPPVVATSGNSSHTTKVPSDSVTPPSNRTGDPPEPPNKPFVRREPSPTPSKVDTAEPDGSNSAAGSEKPPRVLGRGSGQPRRTAVTPKADRSDLPAVQGKKSTSGRSPGRSDRPHTGGRDVDGVGGRGG
jgi:hypothetical protein